MAEYHIYPAGTGTSFGNRIYGLTNVNNNAIGVVSGDSLIFHGTFKADIGDKLIIPASGIRLVCDNAIFDGSTSLNGDLSISNGHLPLTAGNPWVLVDAGLNIWKKGCPSAPFLFRSGELLTPMDTSLAANSEATVLAGLAQDQYTIANVTTAGSTTTGVSLYVRLPVGKTPSNYDFTTTYRLNPTSGTVAGLLYAGQKSDLTFEGLFKAVKTHHSNGRSLPIWIDRCTGVTNYNGSFETEYFNTGGITVSGGTDVIINGSGANSCGAAISIGVPTGLTGDSSYNGGKIEIYNWSATNCATLPQFTSGQVSYNDDYDGGVAIGYKYVNQAEIIVREGSASNCGPDYLQAKSGWAATAGTRGSTVFCGSVDPLTIGKLKVLNNRSINCRMRAFAFTTGDNSTTGTYGSIELKGSLVKGLTQQDYGTFNGSAQTTETGIISFRISGTTQAALTIDASDNTVTDSVYSRSVIEYYLFGTGQAAAATIKSYNNTYAATQKATGYPNDYGVNYIRSALTGSVSIDKNIYPTGAIVGRNVSTNYTAIPWLGYDTNSQIGAVTVASDGSVTAGTANPIGAGYKHWGTNPRPNGINGQPKPDEGLDIGCYQSTLHPFHPANL